MKYIAHRGLFCGPNKENENSPEQIKLALDKGYDCEVDVWRILNEWWLGHDGPTYKIDETFLGKQGLWIHCKNLNALYELSIRPVQYVYFWHQEDDFTLTSNQFIWTYPGKHLSNNSIAVVPERDEKSWEYAKAVSIYGVCTDYIEDFISGTNIFFKL
jgi:hypothetical protein